MSGLYYFGRFLFYSCLKLLYCMRVHNLENIPGRKPFIICSNHIKWADPGTVGAAFPAHYRIRFMAKKELFDYFILSSLVRMAGAFPVDREKADYGAIKTAYKLLNDGQVLGLFPEGSRSKNGKLQKAYNGAAMIAVRSGVPVVPVAIVGPYRFFSPLHVYIGSAFVLPPLVYENKEDKKAQLEEMSYEIMGRIRDLIPATKAV